MLLVKPLLYNEILAIYMLPFLGQNTQIIMNGL